MEQDDNHNRPRIKLIGLPLSQQEQTPLPITLMYCKEHEQVLVEYHGDILVYTSTITPPPLAPILLLTGWLNANGKSAEEYSSPLVMLIESPQPPLLRNTIFNLKIKGQLNSIASLYQFGQFNQSILGFVLGHLESVASKLFVANRLPIPCLCHHHLHSNYSIGSRYASVCIIQQSPNHWQPLINPQAIPLEVVLKRFQYTSKSSISETSWILPNTTRSRHNTIGIKSIWPNYQSKDTTHYQQVEWILYDNVAHCMALALAEMDILLKV